MFCLLTLNSCRQQQNLINQVSLQRLSERTRREFFNIKEKKHSGGRVVCNGSLMGSYCAMCVPCQSQATTSNKKKLHMLSQARNNTYLLLSEEMLVTPSSGEICQMSSEEVSKVLKSLSLLATVTSGSVYRPTFWGISVGDCGFLLHTQTIKNRNSER